MVDPPGTTRAVREPTSADLAVAWQVVRDILPPTPLVSSSVAPDSFLKLETFQPIGAFKVRGALAAISALEEGRRVVTASAGNHGLGVAWAAARLGRSATVVLPERASPAKVAALRAYPVELIEHGAGYDDAEAYALELGARDCAAFVSPYNDPFVIAGQGTIGLELDHQSDGELTVVASVGGGGLLSGLALWARTRRRGSSRRRGVECDRHGLGGDRSRPDRTRDDRSHDRRRPFREPRAGIGHPRHACRCPARVR